jgi:hypothetical protein
LIEVLRGSSRPLTERELAVKLALDPAEERPAEDLRLRLRHVDLPKLAEAGIVDWDEPNATVQIAEDSTSGVGHVRRGTNVSDRRDARLDGANERQRTMLTLLADRDGPRDRSALAYEVAVAECGEAITSEAIEEIDIALHHVHLPTCDRSGLLEYDADGGTVAPVR